MKFRIANEQKKTEQIVDLSYEQGDSNVYRTYVVGRCGEVVNHIGMFSQEGVFKRIALDPGFVEASGIQVDSDGKIICE